MSAILQRFGSLFRGSIKVIPIIVGLIGLTLVIAWISGVFVSKIPPSETQMPQRKLGNQSTDIVHEVTKDYLEEAVGTLKAANRSVISSKILATIQEIHVAAGQFVEEGDPLVTLNTQALSARLNQAKESLAGIQASVRETESDFERYRRLLQSKAVSKQEYDVAERNLSVAQADQRRAEQAVKEAEVLLSYANIKAPKSGRIVDRTAEPGDTAQPGVPILTLYDAQTLRLETPVKESLALRLKVGQELNVRIDSIGQDFKATIDEVVPQADVASRSFLVKASLSRSETIYEGMYGRLMIPAGSRRHLCLATDAIRRIGQLEFVDVVLDDETLQRRLIKTGRLGMPGRVEVLSGLNVGDRVVLSDQSSDEPNTNASDDAADETPETGDREINWDVPGAIR